MVLLLQLGALLAFLGGPLYAADRLRPLLDPRLAFAIGFAPLALLLMGALTLRDEDDVFSRVSIRGGALGALLLAAENGWLLHGLLVAHDSEHPRMSALGAIVGSAAAYGYMRLCSLRRRAGPFALGPSWRVPERIGDWAALVICALGALAGLWMIPAHGDEAVTVFVLFGGMAAFMALHIRGWHRHERTRAASDPPLVIADGASLEPSRRRVLVGFGALGTYGGALSLFGHSFPLPFRILCAGLFLLGLAGFGLAWARVIPPGRLRFERHALFVRTWRYTLEIPWSELAFVEVNVLYGNRMIALQLRDFARISVHPAHQTERAQRAFAQSFAFTGAPLMIATTLYPVDAQTLADELRRRAESAQT